MKSIYYILNLAILSIIMNLNLNANTIYEAENADSIYHGVLESKNAGFSGTGYVNLDNEIGSFFELKVNVTEAGEQTVCIFYANGGTADRPMEIKVNGIAVQTSISFPVTADWTTWNNSNVTLNFNQGDNIIRFTSLVSDGGPNIDKIEISGDVGVAYYKLDINIFGSGTIKKSIDNTTFKEGTEVTITAEPASEFNFMKWKGDINSDTNPLTVKMDSNINIFALFINKGIYVKTNELVGWAGYQYNVTGGEGGTVVTVNNLTDLKSYIGSANKYIIQIDGLIEVTPFGYEIPVGSNTTLLGINNGTLKGGGLSIKNVQNVIVRNLTVKDAFVTMDGKTTDNDGIEVNNSKYVWIDHCDLSYFDDGLLDIKNASDFVTVSWCHFHNHNKVMLIGAGDDATQDEGKLSVTIHHNWFDGNGGIGISQRLPLARYGKIHVFNNYYNNVLVRCIEGNYSSDVVVENNYFLNSEMPHVIVGGTGSIINMNADGNEYINSGTRRDKNGNAFNPSGYYSYSLDDANNIPLIVMLGAGIDADSVIGFPDTTTIVTCDPTKENCDSNATSPTDSLNTIFSNQKNNFSINQNYPNPFRSETKIEYGLNTTSFIQIKVYDLLGNEIACLVNEFKQPGNHSLIFNALKLKPGIYIYQCIANNTIITKNMLKLK